jgi:hypothetical protein
VYESVELGTRLLDFKRVALGHASDAEAASIVHDFSPMALFGGVRL